MDNTILSNLFSAIVGIVVGVILEDPLTKIRDAVTHRARRLFYKKPSRINRSEKFSFGTLISSWYIVDGDGELTYQPKTITTHYENDYLTLPDDLKKRKIKIDKEQDEKRKKGQQFFSNGDRYYLDGFTINRSDYKENLTLELFFGPSDYYTFLATNMGLEDAVLREQYLKDVTWQSPVKYFSNSFGVNLAIITSDEYILIPKRSGLVGTNKNLYNISINEGLSRTFDRGINGQSPDLYRCAIRGAVEELGLSDITAGDVKFLSFGVDTKYAQWALLGMAKTTKTAEEILQWRSRGVKDKWESAEIEIVKFTVKDVVAFVHSHPQWAPAGLACLYHTLVHEFRRVVVDKEIAKHFHS